MSDQIDRHSAGWLPFEQWTSHYDQWFDSEKGNRIFKTETACMKKLLVNAPRPWLEIGVGTGRFAQALQVDEGIDPSPAVLEYASKRGIKTHVGRGENLRFGNNHFGAVIMIVTICFLQNPLQVLNKCRRILKSEGFLLLGLVPKDSAWGQDYMVKAQQNHAFYKTATFYTNAEIVKRCNSAGFSLEKSRSCLMERPNSAVSVYKSSEEGIIFGAGFVCMRFRKNLQSG